MALTWRRSFRAWSPVQRHFVRKQYVSNRRTAIFSQYKKEEYKNHSLFSFLSRALSTLIIITYFFGRARATGTSIISLFLSFFFVLFDLLLGSCSQSHRCLWWMADPQNGRSQTANGQPYLVVDSRSIGLRRDRHGIGGTSRCGGSWIPKILLFLLALRIMTRLESFSLVAEHYLGVVRFLVIFAKGFVLAWLSAGEPRLR